jgi:hypothetical protein
LKSGALLPFAGRFPEVLMGFPFKVIFAIVFFSKLIKVSERETQVGAVWFSRDTKYT